MSSNERYQILLHLSRVSNISMWGAAIHNVVSNYYQKSDAEIEQLLTDLQSQIDDNGRLMQEILGISFDFVNNWRRNAADELNIDAHTKKLVHKALQRYPGRMAQAKALGVSERTLYHLIRKFQLNHNPQNP